MATLTVEHIARIEGHGTVHVAMDGAQVREVRFDVVEPARFFESMIVGRRFDEAPLITSRICGICSPNHAITSIKALEAALGIEVSERTVVLRKLLLYGSYLQNHATHLYLFAAPDFVGQPSVFPLAETHPDVVERALRIKKLGNELTALVGGRPVHPITAVVGGFTAEPDPQRLEQMRQRLLACVEDGRETVTLFDSFEYPEFTSRGDVMALVADDDYAIYEGAIGSADRGTREPVAEYRRVIEERVIAHSNAKHSSVGGSPFMVGAIARAALSSSLLCDEAKAAMAAVGLSEAAGSADRDRNTFHNSLWQAVELVDAAKRCAGYIERLLEMGGSTAPAPIELKAATGAGATEAPRGTLYHGCTLDADGAVASYDVLTPTAQNLANLEADMYELAGQVGGRPADEAQLLIEELVRAYDPCLSCSVH
jgi:sulfhydrogenase subunit alpha